MKSDRHRPPLSITPVKLDRGTRRCVGKVRREKATVPRSVKPPAGRSGDRSLTPFCSLTPSPAWIDRYRWLAIILATCLHASGWRAATAREVSSTVSQPAADHAQEQQSQPQAIALLERVVEMLVHGPAFDAKVRETVWTTGRAVVGVGTYEQAGNGSGRFNLQLTMHDGVGKHRLQQISDGRLAWTRTDIAGKVALRRVDVGRLDQWVGSAAKNMRVSPGMRVGAWAEMLSTIAQDYVLRVTAVQFKGEPVWVIIGGLRGQRREQILTQSRREQWPALCPTRVRIAVRQEPDPKTGFGGLLPFHLEYWSDPVVDRTDSGTTANGAGRLITLIELYSIRQITPPPPERFRFEAEVNFTDQTDQYIESYGVQLTQRQRRQLQR